MAETRERRGERGAAEWGEGNDLPRSILPRRPGPGRRAAHHPPAEPEAVPARGVGADEVPEAHDQDEPPSIADRATASAGPSHAADRRPDPGRRAAGAERRGLRRDVWRQGARLARDRDR